MRVSFMEMGLTASALILLTALLRLAFGRRLPRRAFIALWDIAALRMLLPFSLSLRVFPRTAPRALLGKTAQGAVFTQTLQLPAGGANPIPSASETAAGRLLALLPGILRTIWIAGAAAIAVFFLVRYVRCLRAFALSLPDEDARTVRFLQKHPLRRRVQVRVSDAIASPLSYGVLRPVILLPKAMDRSDDQALCFVLLHELSHIRALDALRKPLLLAALCLHWMNPLSYVLLILASRDMELLCDERVLTAFGSEARRAYALTLLAMEERRGAPFSIASGFSRTAIEERIKAMKNIKPKGIVSLLIATLLVFSSCIAFASGDAAQSGEAQTSTDYVIVRKVDSSSEDDVYLIFQEGGESAEDGIRYTVEVGTLVTGEIASDGAYTMTFTGIADKEDASESNPFLSAESWSQVYSVYEPYGLSYDAQRGRLMFDGKLVRHFEDMIPIDENSYSGTVCSFPDGEVDVSVQRDFSAPVARDADGSYDPSKVYPIVSLQEASQEMFDARTQERKVSATVVSGVAIQSDAQNASDDLTTYWTVDEYRAWLAQERESLQSLVDTGAKGYTGSEGWFEWTQEKLDETLALYEQVLSEIENGALYTVLPNGDTSITVLQVPQN